MSPVITQGVFVRPEHPVQLLQTDHAAKKKAIKRAAAKNRAAPFQFAVSVDRVAAFASCLSARYFMLLPQYLRKNS